MKSLKIALFLSFVIGAKLNAQRCITERSDSTIYTTVEVPPSFPGGHDSLGVYLKYNTIYPEVYQKYAYRETLIVKFVIEKNGSISSVELIQGGFREFEKIALDLVKNMPRWNPAMQNDELRRCYFAILVKFCPEGCAGW